MNTPWIPTKCSSVHLLLAACCLPCTKRGRPWSPSPVLLPPLRACAQLFASTAFPSAQTFALAQDDGAYSEAAVVALCHLAEVDANRTANCPSHLVSSEGHSAHTCCLHPFPAPFLTSCPPPPPPSFTAYTSFTAARLLLRGLRRLQIRSRSTFAFTQTGIGRRSYTGTSWSIPQLRSATQPQPHIKRHKNKAK